MWRPQFNKPPSSWPEFLRFQTCCRLRHGWCWWCCWRPVASSSSRLSHWFTALSCPVTSDGLRGVVLQDPKRPGLGLLTCVCGEVKTFGACVCGSRMKWSCRRWATSRQVNHGMVLNVWSFIFARHFPVWGWSAQRCVCVLRPLYDSC